MAKTAKLAKTETNNVTQTFHAKTKTVRWLLRRQHSDDLNSFQQRISTTKHPICPMVSIISSQIRPLSNHEKWYRYIDSLNMFNL